MCNVVVGGLVRKSDGRAVGDEVLANFKVVQGVLIDRQQEHVQHVETLQALYGKEVLPEELLHFYNVTLKAPLYCPDAAAVAADPDQEVVWRGDLYRVLEKLVLRVEEHPVVTRFWTFAECVRTLLLFHLFSLPPSIYSTISVSLQEKQQKRVAAVKAFWSRPGTAVELRRGLSIASTVRR